MINLQPLSLQYRECPLKIIVYILVKMADPKFGRGVQVLTPNEDHTFSLNEEDLEELFLNDNVKDKPAVVVSIAGAFRKGKSFLLNFFLRFMHQRVCIIFVLYII